MRDEILEASSTVDHPPDHVWRVAGSQELYSRFVPEISWCEVLHPADNGGGQRCLILVNQQRDTVVAERIDAVVHRHAEHIVWTVADDPQRWVSVELRKIDDQRTELVVQAKLPHLAAPLLQRRVNEVAGRIGRHLAGKPARATDLA